MTVFAVIDFGSVLNAALSIVAIATLAGLGLMRGTVTNLRENLADARAEIADKDRRLTELETKSQTQATDLAALGRVVTGEAHWVAIGDKLDEHHGQATTHWAKDETILTEIRDLLQPKGTK